RSRRRHRPPRNAAVEPALDPRGHPLPHPSRAPVTSGRRFDAVIFDMDGVIADSEAAHETAFKAVLNPLGHDVSPELQQELMGHGVDESWAKLRGRFNLADPIETL